MYPRTGATRRRFRALPRAGWWREAARSDTLCHQGLQTRFKDRTVPGRYGSNLQFVRVDSPDIMTIRCETGRGDGADIAEAEDCDSHADRGDRANKPQWDDFIRQTSGGTALRYTAAYPGWLLSARVTHADYERARLSVAQEARLRRAFAGLGRGVPRGRGTIRRGVPMQRPPAAN